MRNLLLACAGIIAFSALSHAGPLAPKDIQATFFAGQPFTASTPKGRRGHEDIVQGRFLHHLER